MAVIVMDWPQLVTVAFPTNNKTIHVHAVDDISEIASGRSDNTRHIHIGLVVVVGVFRRIWT